MWWLLPPVLGLATLWLLAAPVPAVQMADTPRRERRAASLSGWRGAWIAALTHVGRSASADDGFAATVAAAGAPGGLTADEWSAIRRCGIIGGGLSAGLILLFAPGDAKLLAGPALWLGAQPGLSLRAAARQRREWLSLRLPDFSGRIASGLDAGLNIRQAVADAAEAEARSPRSPRWLAAELSAVARHASLAAIGLDGALARLERAAPGAGAGLLRGQLVAAERGGGSTAGALRAFARDHRAQLLAGRKGRVGGVGIALEWTGLIPVMVWFLVLLHTIAPMLMAPLAAYGGR